MRIVLAEDSGLLRESLTNLLVHFGHEVRAVPTAVELLAAVRGERPDVVVTDIRMPPTFTDEGLRAAIELRTDNPALSIESQTDKAGLSSESRADSVGLSMGARVDNPGLSADRVADDPALSIGSWAGNPALPTEARADNLALSIEARLDNPALSGEPRADNPPLSIESRAGNSALSAEARAGNSKLPVLVLSQHADTASLTELFATGDAGIGYLLKDRVANGERFVAAVCEVADGGTVIDQEIVRLLLARQRDPLRTLSERELAVLSLMAEGHDNAGIAAELVVAEVTVAKHIGAIFAKLGLRQEESGHRRVRAVLAYLRGGR